MSTLSVFLNPVSKTEEKEIIISNRFVDESGNPVPFRIRALTQEENDALIKAATKTEFKNGQRIDYLDSIEYNHRVIVAATVYPDFSSKELCDGLGVVSPLLAPGRMLLSGEYNKLMNAVVRLSGMLDGIGDEVKN